MNIKLLLEDIIKTNLLIEGRIEDASKKYSKIPKDIFNYYVDNDPSGNQKYLNWLLKVTEKEWKPNIDDSLAQKHKELLEEVLFFHVNNQSFEKKDINYYKTIESFGAEVDAVIKKVEQKKKEKEAKKQRDLIYQDKDWVVISPKSHLASCVYGSGTQWCVTMKDYSHHWDRYSKNATFFFIIDKNKDDSDNLYKVAFRRIGRKDKLELWDAKDSEFSSRPTGEKYINNLPKKMLELIETHHRVNFPESEGIPEWINNDHRAQALWHHTGDDDLENIGDTHYSIPIYEADGTTYCIATEDELEEAVWDYYDDYDNEDLIDNYDDEGHYMSLYDEEEFINNEVSSYLENRDWDELVEEAGNEESMEELQKELSDLQDSEEFSEVEEESIINRIDELRESSKETVFESEYEEWEYCLRDGVVNCLVYDKGLYRNAYELWESGVVDFERGDLLDSLVANDGWDAITGNYGYEEEVDFDDDTWYVFEVDY